MVALIADLTDAQFERVDITADRILEEIGRIAFADLKSFAAWGPGGVQLVESAELPDGATAVVREVSESPNGAKKIKLHDKLGALVKLAEFKGIGDFRETPEERAAAIRQAMHELDEMTLVGPEAA